MIFNPVYVSNLGETNFDLGALQNNPNKIPTYPNRKDFEPGMIVVAWSSADRWETKLQLLFCDTKQIITLGMPLTSNSYPTFNIQQYTNETASMQVDGSDGAERIDIDFKLENFGYAGTYARFAGAYYLPN